MTPLFSSSKPVYILDGLRTPIGSPLRSLNKFSAAQLAGFVIENLIRKNRINKKQVNEIILGNVVAAGTGQNMARQAALMAKLPVTTPAYMVNTVCGAGLQSVILGAQSICLNDNDIVIAGGTESATYSPLILSKRNKAGESSDSLLHDGLICAMTQKRMGDLVEVLARKHKITRREQDQYSLESHQKACRAKDGQCFLNEIVPVQKDKNTWIRADDRPRRNLDLDMLSELPSSFCPGGSLTVGNSSVPCDGAAAVLLASENFVQKHHLKPKARITGFLSEWGAPKETFELTPGVILRLLKKYGISLRDIDLFEICESFAAQMVFLLRKINMPKDKLNIYGGDLALGHPLGSAGTRALVTLVHALETLKRQKGLVCVSFGGGGTIALIIERDS